LKRYVQRNAIAYIASRLSKSRQEAKKILTGILVRYGEHISLGVEQEFGLDRNDYFQTVWDIPARLVVSKERKLRQSLLALKRRYRLAVVSDAPSVWIKNVLDELGISDIFRDNIFSGEGNERKGTQAAFPRIIKSLGLKPSQVISVGDQEDTDIIPAKNLGLVTVFVGRSKKSRKADFNVSSIRELARLLLNLS